MRARGITSDSGSSRRPGRALVALLLIVVGVCAAAIGAVRWDQEFPTGQIELQSGRQQIVSEEIDLLGQGAPPLVSAPVPYKQAVLTHQVVPADANDDPGIYLYLPVAGHLLGDHNPLSLVKWFFIGCMSLLLLVYPILFYLLFDSLLVALGAPLAVLLGGGFLLNQDIYVIQAWAVLLLLPIVFLAAKLPWRRRLNVSLLAVAALGASFANSVRGHAGTGVAVAAIAVVLMRERTWRSRAGVAGVVVACYVLISPLGFAAIRTYSNHEAHISSAAAGVHGHPFWHHMYLGLGVLPNKWGIQWSDYLASQRATKADPKASYLSPEYERTLRRLYLDIVKDDPSFVARLYATKLAIAIHDAANRFWLPALLAPLVLAAGVQRRRLRRAVLLTTPALLFALVPPVLTVPNASYSEGFLATVGLLSLLVFCGLFVLLRDAWFDLDRAHVRALAERWRAWRGAVCVVLASTLAILGVGIAAAAATNSTSTEVFYQLNASLLEPPPAASTVVKRWSGQALSRWNYRDASLELLRGGALEVRSMLAPPRAPRMTSDGLRLQPGVYVIVADGVVERGGLQLGARDPAQQAELATARYFSGQVGFSSERMQAQFTLTRPETIELSVANWNPHPSASRWLLRSVEIVRLPAPNSLTGAPSLPQVARKT